MSLKKQTNIDLHIHPFENSVYDMAKAMEKTNLDVIALSALDRSIYPQVMEQATKEMGKITYSEKGLMLPSGRCILKAREYNTKEGLHILTAGYTYDQATPKTEIREIIEKGIENDAIVLLDHPFVDNHKTKTAGHVNEELEEKIKGLCEEYEGQIGIEWNSYCIPWMRQVLMHGLNFLGYKIEYYGVNEKAEELTQELAKKGKNIPLVAGSDLHARTKRSLKQMGVARIIIPRTTGDTLYGIIASIKTAIFEGKHQNVKRYATWSHVVGAYCLPVLLPKVFKKPRA